MTWGSWLSPRSLSSCSVSPSCSTQTAGGLVCTHALHQGSRAPFLSLLAAVQAQNAAPDLSQLPDAIGKKLSSAAKGVDPEQIAKPQEAADVVGKRAAQTASSANKQASKARLFWLECVVVFGSSCCLFMSLATSGILWAWGETASSGDQLAFKAGLCWVRHLKPAAASQDYPGNFWPLVGLE